MKDILEIQKECQERCLAKDRHKILTWIMRWCLNRILKWDGVYFIYKSKNYLGIKGVSFDRQYSHIVLDRDVGNLCRSVEDKVKKEKIDCMYMGKDMGGCVIGERAILPEFNRWLSWLSKRKLYEFGRHDGQA